MKSTLFIFVVLLLTVLLVSCEKTTDPIDGEDHYLKGVVKNQQGNNISNAMIHIVWDIADTKVVADGDTLPIEISSFTATIDSDYHVVLRWTTEYETSVSGFFIFRSNDNDLAEAIMISPIISATNSSQPQNYEYTDYEISESGTYYYWLSTQYLDGSVQFYGPLLVNVYIDPYEEVPIVPLTWELVAFGNPFTDVCRIRIGSPFPSNHKLKISSPFLNGFWHYLREDITPGTWQYIWSGRDSVGIDLCNGLYTVDFTATNPGGAVLYNVSQNVLKNTGTRTNAPATYSTTNGYQLGYNAYFQFGKTFHHYSDDFVDLGMMEVPRTFTVYVSKPGYNTISRQVTISDLQADTIENFTLTSK